MSNGSYRWRRIAPQIVAAFVATVALALPASGPLRAENAPDAASLLFDRPQLAQTQPGDVLDYAYRRTSSDPAVFGLPFDDHIRLNVSAGSSPETRTVAVHMFSGSRQRPAGPFSDMAGNPILSLILEDSVQMLSARLNANPRYLKNAIRAALRDEAHVTPDTIGPPGKTSSGWRIVVVPFKNDPNRGRMAGLDNLTFTFKVGRAIPGEIYEIEIAAQDSSGKTLLQEKVDHVQTDP